MKINKYIRLKSPFAVMLFLALFFGGTSIVTAATASTTINSTISSVISVSSTGTVTLNVLPSGSGSQTIGSDTVTVNTNDVAGYTLTLASSTANTYLASGSNQIPASSGSQATPVVQAANTWGYCVSGVGGFGATCPSVGVSNQAISGTNKFAGMPATGSPNTIATTATTAVNATTTVWFAVAANTSQAGSTTPYTGTITYTATAN
jgi:hypothetical protein